LPLGLMVLVVQRDQHLRQRFTSTRERPTSGGHDHLMLSR
jgi:hypothetical protein